MAGKGYNKNMFENVRRDDWESLKPTVYGWGINDVKYNTHESSPIEGKWKILKRCPYYMDWVTMIYRCYDAKHKEKNPAYMGCTICDEWKYLSNFIKWVDIQPNRDWQNCVPDKDFLIEGNKHYSPETVVYIPSSLNSFITAKNKARGKYMLGVRRNSHSKKNPFMSECSNPFTKKCDYLGSFSDELTAHKAWQAKKHEFSCIYADLQDDSRLAKILRERYAPDKDWTKV